MINFKVVLLKQGIKPMILCLRATGIRRMSVLRRRSPPQPDGDPPAQLSARERQTLGEWVTHVERFEFPEISIIRVERPDTVLEKDRRDVSVRDEVSTHRHVAGDVLICV